MPYALGIDLGTTTSCVAVWKNNQVEIIANEHGLRTTPSYVAFNSTERLIGDAAKNQMASNSKNTVFDAKRLIGRKFNDPDVKIVAEHAPYSITSDENGNIRIGVEYKDEEKKILA